MTKHKAPELRILEILHAAADVIDDQGYSNLTMEKIIARTSLSKGGVYRFFGNKREVALALLTRILERWSKIPVDEVVAWRLPLNETLVRMLSSFTEASEEELRYRRIWLQLLPASLKDEEFLAERRRHVDQARAGYMQVIAALIERDGLVELEGSEVFFKRLKDLGTVFVEGMMLVSLTSDQVSGLGEVMRHFVEVVLEPPREKSKPMPESIAY